jgi:hypothetical protein
MNMLRQVLAENVKKIADALEAIAGTLQSIATPKPKIVITVEGGCVVSVCSDIEISDVIVIDYDSLSTDEGSIIEIDGRHAEAGVLPSYCDSKRVREIEDLMEEDDGNVQGKYS